jgi:hypothetical protein
MEDKKLQMTRGNGGGVNLVKGHTKKLFFLESIRKAVDRWTKCVGKQGDCIEK